MHVVMERQVVCPSLTPEPIFALFSDKLSCADDGEKGQKAADTARVVWLQLEERSCGIY